MADIGHNSADKALRDLVERIERMNEEIKELQDDRKCIFAEAKAQGYDAKVLRKVIALRKIERQQREEEQAILETYLASLGML
jgi:uncharacterized protein (UPF0335 family)